MLEPTLLERLKAWCELRNGVASLWHYSGANLGMRQDSGYKFAIELRPTRGKHDWALAEYVAYSDRWRADLSRIVRAEVHLIAFRGELDDPFEPGDRALLIWERTRVIAEVK